MRDSDVSHRSLALAALVARRRFARRRLGEADRGNFRNLLTGLAEALVGPLALSKGDSELLHSALELKSVDTLDVGCGQVQLSEERRLAAAGGMRDGGEVTHTWQ